ncbi:hypothetical protein VII00023_21412 [Vibrio ichthyoenteri ATCC 700023]|uniref:Uncharacterized protein n=1 Tax=Vibrio ichthyoenteri ATCC 700023 TaxID=870968 RepID=F9S5R7_9VIBR|nr:hypothetical protein VII00023_21412 [Vibrio ichthyoenteri ATCC 700023]
MNVRNRFYLMFFAHHRVNGMYLITAQIAQRPKGKRSKRNKKTKEMSDIS